jgi:hypothetical protein
VGRGFGEVKEEVVRFVSMHFLKSAYDRPTMDDVDFNQIFQTRIILL